MKLANGLTKMVFNTEIGFIGNKIANGSTKMVLKIIRLPKMVFKVFNGSTKMVFKVLQYIVLQLYCKTKFISQFLNNFYYREIFFQVNPN